MLIPFAFLSLLSSAAIFGFFYAWVCSTMWGLDAAPPEVAIHAMQAMNASVRNAVFAPAFFGTPFVLFVTAWLARANVTAAVAFSVGGVVYLLGGMILTIMVNVPMNEALAAVELTGAPGQAESIWAAYSPRWQLFNVIRTISSGVALLLAGWGMLMLARAPRNP